MKHSVNKRKKRAAKSRAKSQPIVDNAKDPRHKRRFEQLLDDAVFGVKPRK
jgi:hypothetical protein